MTVLWSNTGKVTIKDVSLRFANVTTAQRDTLNTPTNGDMIYNTTTNALNVYKNGVWTALKDGSELQGLENLVEDTSPQLGGNLDVNGNNIDMGTNIINDTKVGQWDTAYTWGDHSTAGYQTTATFDATVNTHINRSSATSGQVLTWDGSDFSWTTPASGGGGAVLTDNTTVYPAGDYIAFNAGSNQYAWQIYKDGQTNDIVASGQATILTFTLASPATLGTYSWDTGGNHKILVFTRA